MSEINIGRIAKEDKSRTTVYTPIVEAIVNSIQSIEEGGVKNGIINIIFEREKASVLLGKEDEKILRVFKKIKIVDNGIGFNYENLKSFNTFRSDYKIKKGGKGYGRIMYKKYFQETIIKSVYKDKNKFKEVSFQISDNEFVDNKNIREIGVRDLETVLNLNNIKKNELHKELDTISKNILEKLLVYFISYENLPRIILSERGKENSDIILNDVVEDSKEIEKVSSGNFKLKNDLLKIEEEFEVQVFKIYSPNNQSSKIILVADSREVDSTKLMDYIPEFEGEFKDSGDKNYIIKAYVIGKYLDDQVSVERDDFNFNKNGGMVAPFSKKDIEKEVVNIVKENLADKLENRSKKKVLKVEDFISKNPHYKDLSGEIDLDTIKMNPKEEDIDEVFHKASFKREKTARKEINNFIKNYDKNIDIDVNSVLSQISDSQKSELAHYVSLRKVFLKLLSKSLESEVGNSKYKKEDVVHNIIFPTKKDSNNIAFKDHNLWILDERLSFSEYLMSDKQISKTEKVRPDIVNFDERIAYREGEESSNPVTIFEFKKPGRFDFYGSSAKEDPEQQILKYVKKIKENKIVNEKGRNINTGKNTLFYGYIIADYNNKARDWLEIKDFKMLPNGQEWIKYNSHFNLQLHYITWDQLVKNAEQRNSTFFHYLGI